MEVNLRAVLVLVAIAQLSSSKDLYQKSINCTSNENVIGCGGSEEENATTGDECTIENVLFPNEFLGMKSGWFHKYAVLSQGNPRTSKRGNWNWRAVWQIKESTVEGEKVVLIRDHKTIKHLSFNRDMFSYLRGEGNPRIKDNFWIISKAGEGSEVTIQRFMTPREYLHAKSDQKYADRQLVMEKDSNSNGSLWRIDCKIEAA